MDNAPPGGATPAPRITDPVPGGHVAAGASAAVTLNTNAPGLPLELLLLSADDPGVELARVNIEAGAAFPSTHGIAIPPGSQPVSYYLAVGVRAGSATEQYRHVIPVTTGPADR